MEAETNYFAYCLDTETKINYFIIPTKFLKPRTKAINPKPGVAWVTLGQQFWGAVFQSAWHESLEVDPEDGSFLDNKAKTDKDFELLLTNAEYKDCLVLATASSVEELQVFVETCNIKVPKKYKRLDDSIASGSRQHDEPQQQNKRFRSTSPANFSEYKQKMSYKDFSMVSEELNPESTGANPFVTPEILKDIEMKEPNESHDVSENAKIGDTHIRPEGTANLGFFESEIDGRVTRQNADNVCVLVIHYDFKNNAYMFRSGDTCDVDKLKTSFKENRNCNFRDLSPNKKTLLQFLGDDKDLLQLFNSQDDVPSVFLLFILSHGSENGMILTDHIDWKTNKYEYFTTDEVFDSLQRLQSFDKCLKVVNFGPCRDTLEDSKFDIKKSYAMYDNKNSCRITTRPRMHNYVVFLSTVETTMESIDTNGSWFVRNICTCLNSADDEPLLKFLTIVQNRMHQESRYLVNLLQNTHIGQTPELKMFQQDRKFIISKAKIAANTFSNTDTVPPSDVSEVSDKIYPEEFSWISDEGQEMRRRRSFILSVVQNKQVQEMKRVLQNLDFGIRDWILSGKSMEFYFEMVSELEPDVGCILTCIFGPVCVNEQKEVCVRVGQEVHPVTKILHSLVGPKNDKLIGKPKILFVVNVDESETDDGRVSPNDELLGNPNNQFDVEAPQRDHIIVDMKDLQVTATNHSGWLVLILKYEDALKKMIELFGNIGEKCLQDLLDPLLTRESNSEDVVLLNSTLQYLVKFSVLPITFFVKPDFNLKKKITSHVQIEKKMNFDIFLNEAKILFEENKKSIMSSQMSNRVKDLEAMYAARNLAEVSIVSLFSSVAGAGKSTVLKEMAHQLTKYCGGFKILLIPLKKYYRYLLDMPAVKVDEIDFLARTTCNSHDDIINWMEKRELIVFLDGLDEVCPDFREKIIKILIVLNNARVPLFIGTRPHEVHQIQDRIKNTTMVEIEPLDEAKQIEFLKITAGKKPMEIKKLLTILKNKELLGNPLYLKLLAEYKGDGNLYDIFDTIVRRKVELCLKREHGVIDVGEEIIEKSLKVIQLVASRFVTRVKIDQGSVTKEALEKMNAFGVVTYCNERVNFTHQTFAEFLTAQKFLYDLKNPGREMVPLFNDELVQCRKFVDLFFSTEKGKDATYAEDFVECAKFTDPLKLVSQICRENLRQMFELLNPDLSLKDEDGKNALHFALRHLEMVKMVHEKNSKLADQETNNGESCLHLAIDDEECSEEVALWLLQNTEVDKNAETKTRNTPLLLAGARKKWEVVEKLVFSNVELKKFSPDGKSILHYAMLSNKLDLVIGLIDRGSNVNLKDYSGATALHLASGWNGNPDIVKILIENGAEVNAQDIEKRTALHYAAEKNPNAEVILTLIENGADIYSQDRKRITALHLAAQSNENPEIVKLLLKMSAEVDLQDNENRTALHYATKNHQNTEIVRTLLGNGADVNSEDQEGRTALHLAAWYNENPEILQILIDNRADVNAKDNYDWTALHYAARFNPNPEVVQKLIDNDAEINAENDDEENALFLAAKYNPVKEVSQKLFDHAAEVNEMINSD